MPAISFDKPTERNTEVLKTKMTLTGHKTKVSEGASRHQTILNNITEGYFEVDIFGNLTFFNDAMCQILGYLKHELIGMNYRNYMDTNNAAKVFHSFNEVYKTRKAIKAFDWELIRKNGSKCFVETSVLIISNSRGELEGFRGIVRDVTERKKAEQEKEKLRERLYQSQQKEIIGTLANGIAHDFSNILSSIIGYVELSLLSLDQAQKGTKLHDNMTKVITAGNYAKDLIKQILTISRNKKKQTLYFEIIPKINEALKILQSSIPATIDFQQKVCNDKLMINGDPTQIQRVVFNLVINAHQAITNATGIIKILVRPVKAPKKIIKEYQESTSTRYILISVSDTGAGIQEHSLEKIFNPYFTTKGDGTGLGLSIVYGVVKSHDGYIKVYSRPGKGSRFYVYLPLLEEKNVDDKYSSNQKEVQS